MARAERIRIAYCLDSFGIGGTELNAVRTAEALDPRKFELRVFHLWRDGPLRARYEALGLQMIHCPIGNLYSPATALQGLRLASQLREWDADVLHSHDIYNNIFAVPWARTFGRCKVIASRRWAYDTPRHGLVALNRWSYRFAHRVLVNSPSVARLLADEERVPTAKIVVVPNFLDDSAFILLDEGAREEQRAAWGIPPGAFVLGSVARLAPVKNHAQLLRAAALLDVDVHVLLIGGGDDRPALESLAMQLGIASRVHFTGELVLPVNLHQFFEVSVSCSMSEGFPNSIIEAMAAARPVVATPVGGVVDVLEDGENGISVPVADPTALAGAVRRLRDDAKLRDQLAETGCSQVRVRFGKPAAMLRLSALYESLAPVTRTQA